MKISFKDIYASLRERFESVCERVFIDSAPVAVVDPMKSYLILDIDDVTRNGGIWRKSRMRIWVSVRRRESGVEDLPEIDTLTNEVLKRLPYSNDLLSITSRGISMGMQEGEFTYSLIECDLLIKYND